MIRIMGSAATALASDSAITIARSRPSKPERLWSDFLGFRARNGSVASQICSLSSSSRTCQLSRGHSIRRQAKASIPTRALAVPTVSSHVSTWLKNPEDIEEIPYLNAFSSGNRFLDVRLRANGVVRKWGRTDLTGF